MKVFSFVILSLFSSICMFSNQVREQDSETLTGSDVSIGSLWSLELKTNSVQREIGSSISVYWATVIDRSVILGLGGFWNLTHTVTNYGSFQLLAQYVPEPDRLLHFGGQLMLGFATVKDYQNPKNGLFDNFGNTSGASYYMIEPGVSAELNLTTSKKLVLGLGYCAAFGLEANHSSIAKSNVTNRDLSGLNIIIGLKFGDY
ncbi:MAG: hypothetical protein WBD36_01460 [Bacteroidota bacterium]